MFKNGSLFLFRLFGIDVSLHWSWVLIPVVQHYVPGFFGGFVESSLALNIALYVSLFAIVLSHEFGHALACKSVGGRAERIVLMPLGGIAFVQPPPRPGAHLWSIAAGPLVNVLLLPLTIVPAVFLNPDIAMLQSAPGPLAQYFYHLAFINTGLLVFNMLPFYPLDGGQIIQALLWFIVGRSTSLLLTAGVGVLGAFALFTFAIMRGDGFSIFIALFAGSLAFRGIRMGLNLRKLDKMPRHPEPTCPACGKHPIIGNFWRCNCGAQFDTFATGGSCPNCGHAFATTRCLECRQDAPLDRWYSQGGFPVQSTPPPPLPPPIIQPDEEPSPFP